MSLRDRLAETLRWLCATPSPTGQEAPLCDALVARLGAVAHLGPIRRYHNSLVVPVATATGGPRIALCGHLDVVPVDHDGPVRIDGDRLYGPGASDMKAGIAAALDVCEHDRDACGGVELLLVLYAGEEGPFVANELGTVLERDPELPRVDLAVCLEPSENRLGLGACGSIQAELELHGRAAHSARPWLGDNAIHRAGPLLCDLAALPAREVELDGLVYRSVTSATLIAGGRARNVVPERCVVGINHRITPAETIADGQRYLEQLVSGRGELRWIDLSPPAPPCASHPLVVALRDAGADGVEPKQGWTDVARFALQGIAAVNFGPGTPEQAHQRNEWASLTKLEHGRTILAHWLRAVAGRRTEPGSTQP